MPGLVPTRARILAERECLQKDKEGDEVDQGLFLSQVLSSKRRLSDAKAMKIAETLGMGGRESRFFRLLVRRDTARSDSLRTATGPVAD